MNLRLQLGSAVFGHCFYFPAGERNKRFLHLLNSGEINSDFHTFTLNLHCTAKKRIGASLTVAQSRREIIGCVREEVFV